jgi:hypothetical protein
VLTCGKRVSLINLTIFNILMPSVYSSWECGDGLGKSLVQRDVAQGAKTLFCFSVKYLIKNSSRYRSRLCRRRQSTLERVTKWTRLALISFCSLPTSGT